MSVHEVESAEREFLLEVFYVLLFIHYAGYSCRIRLNRYLKLFAGQKCSATRNRHFYRAGWAAMDYSIFLGTSHRSVSAFNHGSTQTMADAFSNYRGFGFCLSH